MTTRKTPRHIKLDERNHVEKPLLEQLDGLGWKIIDLTDIEGEARQDLPGKLYRSRHAAGIARTAQGYQSVAGRRSGRGSRQATHRELPRHGIDREQQARVSPASGEHERQRKPANGREKPGRAVH